MLNTEKYLLVKMQSFIKNDLNKKNNVNEDYINIFINKSFLYIQKAIEQLLKKNIINLSDEYIYEIMMNQLKKYIDNEYDLHVNYINFKINIELENTPLIYNMFKYDFYGLPIDNLENIAIDGIIKFIYINNNFEYKSNYIKNPKWFDICKCCHNMLILSKEKEYITLNGITKGRYDNEYYFDMQCCN
jgi:hypothetical protein